MSPIGPLQYPKMRPVEVRASPDHAGAYLVFDPAGITPSTLTVSPATLSILAPMDGRHDRPAIQAEFMRRHGHMLFSDEMDQLIRHLDEALLLETPRFEERRTKLVEAYRRAPTRKIRDVHSLGAPIDRLGPYLNRLLTTPPDGPAPVRQAGLNRAGDNPRLLMGIVAPHLDYKRGAPCYAAAYRDLRQRTQASRFVILGTNHFGRSTAVVGTRKDFETPLGIVPHDGSFMQRLSERLGTDLCVEEYDHVREHSIELQVLLLRHLLHDREFTIVPFLCPDPRGPNGTAPRDGRGPDLDDFAAALRAEIKANPTATCLIAAADLSHVGRFFNDARDLDDENLQEIEALERELLAHVEAGDARGFRDAVAKTGNDTNICSVGCIYALTEALRDVAEPRLLHYHQAVTPEAENCVTCAAMEFMAVG